MQEVCYWLLCFAPPDKSSVPRVFGFAEFISALALLVITYTLVDVRYRFRLAIAPTPLYRRTFFVMGLIGAEALATEIWYAQSWWLPKTFYLSRPIWEGYFGLLFLITFMTWVWYAYMRPPIYGKSNYRSYARELYSYIVKGSDSELAVIADEIRRSAKALILFAPAVPRRVDSVEGSAKREISEVEGFAHDVLLLIANRKLCRHIVASASTTATVFFEEAASAKKYHIPMGTFATNLTTEAIANSDSLLYHEADKFSSGLIGKFQPFSKAIYGHYRLVEGLAEQWGSPLDVDYSEYADWSAHEWRAYNRAVVTALGAYANEGSSNHSFALHRAVHSIEHSFGDTYKLRAIDEGYYDSDVYRRLRAAVEFACDAIEAIDKQNKRPPVRQLRRLASNHNSDIYDLLAGLMFELVFAASMVKGPIDKAWSIHFNTVWSRLFESWNSSPTGKVVRFKLRRLLYDEIASIETLPNFKNAAILGVCLNVSGLTTRKDSGTRSYRALTDAILPIAQRCYQKLWRERPRVAEAVLIGGISYDMRRNCLVKTYSQGLDVEPSTASLPLVQHYPRPDGTDPPAPRKVSRRRQGRCPRCDS